MSETRIFTVDVKVRVRSRGRGGGPAGAVQRSPQNDEARELTPGSRATLKRRILPATRAPLPAGRVADRRGALVPAVPDRAETVRAFGRP